MPAVDQREERQDPLATPDVDRYSFFHYSNKCMFYHMLYLLLNIMKMGKFMTPVV